MVFEGDRDDVAQMSANQLFTGDFVLLGQPADREFVLVFTRELGIGVGRGDVVRERGVCLTGHVYFGCAVFLSLRLRAGIRASSAKFC